MELFGLASGSSGQGPSFPYLPECILKNYPLCLLHHPAVPDVNIAELLAGDTNTQMTMNLPGLIKSMATGSTSFVDKSTLRYISIGAAASIVVLSAWGASKFWSKTPKKTQRSRSNFSVSKKPPENTCKPVTEAMEVETTVRENPETKTKMAILTDIKPPEEKEDQELTASSQFQQQFTESVIVRLTDARCRLQQLESQREVLFAEIRLRKDMVRMLQRENNEEREKRQQAELKMEMVQIENAQVDKLRKDLAYKQSQIELLEYKYNQKQQFPCGQVNEALVRPRTDERSDTIANKELETLETRLQYLETALALQREACDEKGDSCRSPSPAKNSPQYPSRCAHHISRAQPPEEDPENDWKKSPQRANKKMDSPQRKFNKGIDKTAGCEQNSSAGRKESSPRFTFTAKRPSQEHRSERETFSVSKIQYNPSFIGDVFDCDEHTIKHHDLTNVESRSCSDATASLSENLIAEKSPSNGVLAHIKSFFQNFNDEQLKNVERKSNGCLDNMFEEKGMDLKRKMKIGQGYNKRTKVLQEKSPLSDESVFLSASCGSLSSPEIHPKTGDSKTINVKSKPFRKKNQRTNNSKRRDRKAKQAKMAKTKEVKTERDPHLLDNNVNTSDNNNDLSAFMKRSIKATERSPNKSSTGKTEKSPGTPVCPHLSSQESCVTENAIEDISTRDNKVQGCNLSDKTDSESEQSWIVITPSTEGVEDGK